MAMQLEPATLQRLPEEYIIEEDLAEMGDTNPHIQTLATTLNKSLSWRYQKEGWHTGQKHERLPPGNYQQPPLYRTGRNAHKDRVAFL